MKCIYLLTAAISLATALPASLNTDFSNANSLQGLEKRLPPSKGKPEAPYPAPVKYPDDELRSGYKSDESNVGKNEEDGQEEGVNDITGGGVIVRL